jgi:DNA polymerase elongation subunit (family B)
MKMALMYTSNGFPQVSKTRVTYYMDNFSIMVDDYYMDDYYIVEVEASDEKYLSQFDSVVKEEDRSSLFGKEWSNFNIAKDGLPIN